MNTTRLSLFLLGLFAAFLFVNAQNNCIVKSIHLLPNGSPIDIRVGDVMVATNLAFQRSQVSQANVPCGPQPVRLFPASNETSFRMENFVIASGENIYNYIVFGGEIRAPADTNVFLLSLEPVQMPPKRTGQIQLSFWHYAPVVREEQVQMDVLNGEETVLTAVANFQQRTNYQSAPNAQAFTFQFSDLSLEEIFSADRSLIAVRDGAGTAFIIGGTDPQLFLESDPVGPEAADGSDGATDGSSSQGSDGATDGTGSSTDESSSVGSTDGGNLSGSASNDQDTSSAASLQPLLAALF